ncbi:uncharacterized protein [Dermacentor albipictus]|uniref:uncharacterized protein isoform X1 n=1 Tax=Dermacentor albipictus TaxID=60249 RepID=UPI0031FCB7EC
MDRRRLAFVLLWQIVAVQGMVRERWHYYAPKCHVPGPQPIVPREWGQEWSSCNGAKQSPVLLLPHKSIGVAVPPLIFKHFSTPLANPVVYNTGRTLRVRASMPKPIVTGGLLAEEYVFDQAEFHWGRDDHSGSEHIVDALSYAVEVQMTFRLRTPSARVDCRECPPAYVGLATQLKLEDHWHTNLTQKSTLTGCRLLALVADGSPAQPSSAHAHRLPELGDVRVGADRPAPPAAADRLHAQRHAQLLHVRGLADGAALHRERAVDRLPGAHVHRPGTGKDAPTALRLPGGDLLQQTPGGQPEAPAGDWAYEDALPNVQFCPFEVAAELHHDPGVHPVILQEHNLAPKRMSLNDVTLN